MIRNTPTIQRTKWQSVGIFRRDSAALIALGVLCLALAMPSRMDAATGPFKMQIQFSGYNRGETLTNFPALVVFSNGMGGTSFTFTNYQFLSANGYDLRFTDSTQSTNLNYEIEAWTNSYIPGGIRVGAGAALSSGCYIWAAWGNSSNTNQLPCTTNGAMWPTNAFVGVWHMGQSNTRDSTANRNNGSANGSVTNAVGVIGGAQGVAGGYELVAASSSLEFATTAATVSGWVRFNALPTGNGNEQAITRTANQWALEAIVDGSTLMRNLLYTSGTSGWTAGNDKFSVRLRLWVSGSTSPSRTMAPSYAILKTGCRSASTP